MLPKTSCSWSVSGMTPKVDSFPLGWWPPPSGKFLFSSACSVFMLVRVIRSVGFTYVKYEALLFMLVFGHDGSSAIKFNYYYELFVSFRALIQLPREHTSTFESLKVNQECSLVFGWSFKESLLQFQNPKMTVEKTLNLRLHKPAGDIMVLCPSMMWTRT